MTYHYDAVSPHFTGKERDSESGLDNFGARYNSSNFGRFMSPDPINLTAKRWTNGDRRDVSAVPGIVHPESMLFFELQLFTYPPSLSIFELTHSRQAT